MASLSTLDKSFGIRIASKIIKFYVKLILSPFFLFLSMETVFKCKQRKLLLVSGVEYLSDVTCFGGPWNPRCSLVVLYSSLCGHCRDIGTLPSELEDFIKYLE